MEINKEYLREFIFNKYKTQIFHFQCKFNIVKVIKYTPWHKKKNINCTFIIPHKNCADFLKLALKNIRSHTKKITYEIIIVDDFSEENEFRKLIEMLTPEVTLYRFTKGRGHPFALEWLYHRVRSPYVATLDQNSILLSDSWEDLLCEFDNNKNLLLIGMRDKCSIRDNPQMVHPSFILINKRRCTKYLSSPLFFGDRPFYQKYHIDQKEPYHTLSCKALAFNYLSVKYLDTYQTKYGFGTVGYYQNLNKPMVYHQWYSGRIYTLKDESIIDGLLVKEIKQGISNFLDDYKLCKINLLKI